VQNFELCRRRGFKEFDTEAASKLRLPKQHLPTDKDCGASYRGMKENSKHNLNKIEQNCNSCKYFDRNGQNFDLSVKWQCLFGFSAGKGKSRSTTPFWHPASANFFRGLSKQGLADPEKYEEIDMVVSILYPFWKIQEKASQGPPRQFGNFLQQNF